MNDELKSTTTSTWLLMLFLSSPVIVQCIKIVKETFQGSKQDQTAVMLEMALVELIMHRKQQELQATQPQKIVYVPVAPQSMNRQLQPYVGSVSPHVTLMRMQQDLKQQFDRVALLNQQSKNAPVDVNAFSAQRNFTSPVSKAELAYVDEKQKRIPASIMSNS